jgi:hypothetical protein
MIVYATAPAALPPVTRWQMDLARQLHQTRLRTRAARALAGLAGLGDDCPSFAQYRLPDGTCSNLPASYWGEDTGTRVVQTPYTSPETLPAGYFMNPATGQVEQVPDIAGSSFAERITRPGELEQTAADAQAEGAEAERQGRALGLNVSCQVVPNCDVVGNNCRYWSDCTVNGTEGHDAGLLIRPGGWNIASVESGALLPATSPQAVPFVPLVTAASPAPAPSGPSAPPAASGGNGTGGGGGAPTGATGGGAGSGTASGGAPPTASGAGADSASAAGASAFAFLSTPILGVPALVWGAGLLGAMFVFGGGHDRY